MLQYTPGSLFRRSFTTVAAAGGSASLDSIDTLRVKRNGIIDVAVTPIAVQTETGLYDATFTIPVGYESGDHVTVQVQGTLGTSQEWYILDEFHVQASTLDNIAEIVGTGVGPFAVTGTVRDADTLTLIQGAKVRATGSGESAEDTTDVDGVWELSLSAATFSLLVIKGGYLAAAPQELVVTGDQSAPVIELEAQTFTVIVPGLTTGTITVLSITGVPVEDAVVKVTIIRLANGVVGIGIADPTATATTDANGFAQFPGLPRLALYECSIDGGTIYTGTTLDEAETPLKGTLGMITTIES